MNEWFAEAADKFQIAFIEGDRWKLYLNGLGVTLQISLFAAILGVAIGIVVALMKLSTGKNGKRSIFSYIAQIYIDVIRGTPSVLQLLIMWFIVMTNSKNGVLVAVLTFGINSGAYVSEIMRAGIQAVDHGQMEAGRSLGLSKGQTMRYIILPQAVKNVLPPIGNEFIVLLKETAIVGYVSLSDLTRTAIQISSKIGEKYLRLFSKAIIAKQIFRFIIPKLTVLFII